MRISKGEIIILAVGLSGNKCVSYKVMHLYEPVILCWLGDVHYAFTEIFVFTYSLGSVLRKIWV